MKNNLLFGASILVSTIGISQQHWCGFDAHNAKLNAENPGREQAIHEHMSLANDHDAMSGERTATYIIPVVVHVIHDGGEGNISYEQILSGIQMLNEDWGRDNPDTIDTRNTGTAPFEPVAADMDIEFRLAKIDPNGNCTNGVERRYSPSATNNADDGAKHTSTGGLNAWDRNKYMNLWVVNSINSDGSGGVILGYAEFPYWGGSSDYGVIIRHDAFGYTGTASGDRTLSHEIGHCLGLSHTFEGGCHTDDCGDNGDYCCDTPPESEAHWSCGVGQNSCTGVPVNDPFGFDALDQWENFMSYAPCQNMFSIDQMDIVHYNLGDITFLANLTSPANAIATGVMDPDVLCQAEFTSTYTTICQGSAIQFHDESYFSVTDRTWTFDGGTPATSTDPDPLITFNTPGIYNVTLEVTDGLSTVSETSPSYVIVLATTGETLPYSEGFENFTLFPDNEEFMTQNDDGMAWNITTSASYTGNQSLKLKNFAETIGTIDAFTSGTIDLSGVDTLDDMVFNFRYAHRKRSSSNDEWLRFYISKDCGETWVLRKNWHGNSLSDQIKTSPYTPADTSEWYYADVINIYPDYYVSNFRYKFEFENDNGNNIYIDNINLYPASMVGVEETITTNATFSIYPNPAVGDIRVNYTPVAGSWCRIFVRDALGQVVGIIYEGNVLTGENTFGYSASDLQAGVYFVTIESEGTTETLKFIKQ
jgi:PKD repeat protein